MNNKIKELVRLAEENPGMEIKAAVESDVCPDDSFAYWIAEFTKAEKAEYFLDDEKIYIGIDKIEEYLYYEYDDYSDAKIKDEIECMRMAKIIREAIFVYIGI